MSYCPLFDRQSTGGNPLDCADYSAAEKVRLSDKKDKARAIALCAVAARGFFSTFFIFFIVSCHRDLPAIENLL